MTDQVENSNEKSNWGGSRPGAGRPKGSENPETKERRIAESRMRQRIVDSTDSLVNAQMTLAKGEVNLYCIRYEGDGKNRRKIIEVVNDQEIIKAFLAEELNQSGDNEYYYIATKSPDPRSIDSLLDRTYGKARQSMDVNIQEMPQPILGGSSVHRNEGDPQTQEPPQAD